MKKLLIILSILVLFFTLNSIDTQVIIPKQAIRFRVIASSNSDTDQQTKLLVRNVLEQEITSDLSNVSNINDARNTIKNNLSNYSTTIKSTLLENNLDNTFSLNYGMNYFPKKIYKGVTYEEGEYESLVVTLGDGLGKNWWCVLFPPLCLLEAEETQTDEVEYKSFIKELIDKYF